MPKKLRVGAGAKCSALKRFLHPRKFEDGKYPNNVARERLGGLVAMRKDTMEVNHKDQICILFCHADFPDALLHCVE